MPVEPQVVEIVFYKVFCAECEIDKGAKLGPMTSKKSEAMAYLEFHKERYHNNG